MPWEEREPMTERMKFMMEVESGLYRFSEICARYGVSRKTGYKWWQRYQEAGVAALQEHSRAPLCCPHKTAPELEEKIVKMREGHPKWGPVSVHYRLQRLEPEVAWPSVSTIGEILKRRGLLQPRRRHRRPQALYRSSDQVRTDQPNQIFTADFKGEFRLGDRRYCYPLTIQDHYSRYALSCQALRSTAGGPARRQFERVFREYGLPQAILTDNGVPFAGNGLRRLSRLSVWWIRLGIRPLLIRPGHPEENSRHERYHRTLKEQATRPPAADHASQQGIFDRFRREYNQERPHQCLQGKTPAEVYAPSPRPYPRRLPVPEYPGHYEVRRVSINGYVKLHGTTIFLSGVLQYERVGLEEIQDGVWSIYLADALLARWDERQGKIYG